MNDAIAGAIAAEITKTLAEYGDESEYLKIIVFGMDLDEVHFKMKYCTRLGKMKKYYADRKNISVDSFNIYYKGEIILDDHSPTLLDMKDGDEIEAMTLIQAAYELQCLEKLRKEQEELAIKDPLHKEKQALEKMENGKRKAMGRAAMSRNENRKAMKAEKRKNKNNRKMNETNADDDYDNDEGRVPCLPSDHGHEDHVCCGHCGLHTCGGLELQDEVGSDDDSAHSPFSLYFASTRKKDDDDSSSDEKDAKNQLMPLDFWKQFCRMVPRDRFFPKYKK